MSEPVSLVRKTGRLHRTHDVVVMVNLNSLYGCIRCWRLMALTPVPNRRVLTLAASEACNPDHELAEILRGAFNSSVAEGRRRGTLIGMSLGTALRGQRGGRHASGS